MSAAPYDYKSHTLPVITGNHKPPPGGFSFAVRVSRDPANRLRPVSSYDPTDIHGQERAQEQEAQRQQRNKDTEESDFKWLMGSKRGRRIVWRQVDRARPFDPSFNTNSMAMAFTEGAKDEGRRIVRMINALCPELYHVMLNEAKTDDRSDDDSRN